MKRKSIRVLITAPLACAVIILSGCSHARANIPDISNFTARTRYTTEGFGTISVLRLYEDYSEGKNIARFERVWEQVKGLLRELDSVFSPDIETSDVSRYNALEYGESIQVSAHMAHVIEISKSACEEMGGFFDPTVFPLVDLWGFTPRFRTNRFTPVYPYDRPGGRATLPDPEYEEAFLRLVDLNGVILSGGADGFTLKKMTPPVTVNGTVYQAKLDFSAIAKGYAADLVFDILTREGFRFGYFSCGGSSMTLLKGMDRVSAEEGNYSFELGLRKPRPGMNDTSSFIEVMVSDTNLSTSGDYDNAFFVDGVRYSHIFDPETGRPINPPGETPQRGFAIAVVIGSGAARVEAFSTGLLAMPPEDAIAYINDMLQDCMVVLVYYETGQEYYEIITNIPQELITVRDSAYVTACRLDEYGKIEYTGTLMFHSH